MDLLKKVRFFNRFDDEALQMMLTKVTLRRVPKGSILFLKGPEACIVVAGNLQLVSHEEDLATPHIAATYHPGDAIGLADIDNGWHCAKHSWLCAWQDCDVFMISTAYLAYMCHNMKRLHANIVADMLNQAP